MKIHDYEQAGPRANSEEGNDRPQPVCDEFTVWLGSRAQLLLQPTTTSSTTCEPRTQPTMAAMESPPQQFGCTSYYSRARHRLVGMTVIPTAPATLLTLTSYSLSLSLPTHLHTSPRSIVGLLRRFYFACQQVAFIYKVSCKSSDLTVLALFSCS